MDDFSTNQILSLLAAVDCRIAVLTSVLARLSTNSSSYADTDKELFNYLFLKEKLQRYLCE